MSVLSTNDLAGELEKLRNKNLIFGSLCSCKDEKKSQIFLDIRIDMQFGES